MGSLVLEDGTVLRGRPFGATGTAAAGEVGECPLGKERFSGAAAAAARGGFSGGAVKPPAPFPRLSTWHAA